mgnify:CR=1 FL=1
MKRFFLLLLAAIIGLLPLMSACAEAPLDGYPGRKADGGRTREAASP